MRFLPALPEKDLHLTSRQYNIALTIFFFPYALFEPVTNVLLKRLSPRWFLSGILFLWSIAMIARKSMPLVVARLTPYQPLLLISVEGLVHNYHQLLAVRFLLGMCEAGYAFSFHFCTLDVRSPAIWFVS